MRSPYDYLTPEQQQAIAQRYYSQAIAELPSSATLAERINKAIALGKLWALQSSDFEGIEGNSTII